MKEMTFGSDEPLTLRIADPDELQRQKAIVAKDEFEHLQNLSEHFFVVETLGEPSKTEWMGDMAFLDYVVPYMNILQLEALGELETVGELEESIAHVDQVAARLMEFEPTFWKIPYMRAKNYLYYVSVMQVQKKYQEIIPMTPDAFLDYADAVNFLPPLPNSLLNPFLFSDVEVPLLTPNSRSDNFLPPLPNSLLNPFRFSAVDIKEPLISLAKYLLHQMSDSYSVDGQPGLSIYKTDVEVLLLTLKSRSVKHAAPKEADHLIEHVLADYQELLGQGTFREQGVAAQTVKNYGYTVKLHSDKTMKQKGEAYMQSADSVLDELIPS